MDSFLGIEQGAIVVHPSVPQAVKQLRAMGDSLPPLLRPRLKCFEEFLNNVEKLKKFKFGLLSRKDAENLVKVFESHSDTLEEMYKGSYFGNNTDTIKEAVGKYFPQADKETQGSLLWFWREFWLLSEVVDMIAWSLTLEVSENLSFEGVVARYDGKPSSLQSALMALAA